MPGTLGLPTAAPRSRRSNQATLVGQGSDSAPCLIQNLLAVWDLWHRASSVSAQDPHTSSSVTATAPRRDPEADGADDNRRSQEPGPLWLTHAPVYRPSKSSQYTVSITISYSFRRTP